MEKIPLIAIVGPTASGKTKVSVEIAKRFNGEIVSCDSMQIYKDMDIATAKPTIEERQGIQHHLMGFVECDRAFSVAEYVELAHEVIQDIHKRGKTPILVGGTGLYFNSLVDNLTFNEASEDQILRSSLLDYAKQYSNEALHKKLELVDPQAATKIHPNNVIRVIRAIESFELTGRTMEQNNELSRRKESKYNLCAIGLNFIDRKDLYDRIDKRVDIMMQDGLLDEAKKVYQMKQLKTSVQAIGYKELFEYFEGKCELTTAVDKIKQESRRYAKRQLTWFRKDQRINWVYATRDIDFLTILENIYKTIDKWKKM